MIEQGKIFFLLLVILIGMISCETSRKNENTIALAEVGNTVLLKSQLEKAFPANITDETDSIEFVNDYINKWIKQQLLVKEAEKNLSNEELDVSQELEEYRQELLIHKFKNKKFEALNDQQVSDSEIEKYYKKHSNLFILDYPIVQVNYIIFPEEVDLPKNFKKQLASNKEADKVKCEDFIFKYAKKYDDFENKWIYFQRFKDVGSLDIADDKKFLKKNDLIEFNKDSELHLIYIRDYMSEGEQAPVDFVKSRIGSLIINEKKLDFLRQFKDSLYNAALKYNNFRVLNQ